MKYSRILVTGGAGFIGGHLVDALISEGCEIVVLDNLWSGKVENIKHHLDDADLRFIRGDVRSGQAVEEAGRGAEAVFHLAAITSMPYSIKSPCVTREVNVEGTRNLLEVSLRNDVDLFTFVSSCAVYGEAEYLPIDERHPTNPVSPYAESKLEAERCCREFGEAHGLKVTILRIFNAYGPRMRSDQYGGVITRFVERLRYGKPPVIYGNGFQTRDFVHVEDVVKAMMLVLGSNNVVNRTFNVATGVPTTINQLAQLLMQMVGVEGVRPRYRGARQGDVRHSYADVRGAREAFGYEPRVCLNEGLLTLIR